MRKQLPLNADSLARLAAALTAGGLAAIEYRDADTALSLRMHSGMPRQPAAAAALRVQGPAVSPGMVPTPSLPRVAVSAPTPALIVKSPGLGIFRHHHPLAPTVTPARGNNIEADQILAYLQVKSVLTPVYARQAGRLREVLKHDGALVGYADPLFALDSPAGE